MKCFHPSIVRTLFALITAIRVSAAEAATRPNIILCMTDDQGWGDVSCHGLKHIQTPNLDAMAAAGLRLDRFYAAHPSCSPTRASVMTGRHPYRSGVFWPGMPLRKQEMTLAQAVKRVGYATGHFGKWHLSGGKPGMGRPLPASDPLHPGNFGFDEWFTVSNWFDTNWTFSRNGTPVKVIGDGSDAIVAEALTFIGKNAAAKTPFFTVIWFGSPHVPLAPTAADLAAAGDSPYYGELLGVDRSMGTLRNALRKLGIADNTLMVFNSDNGAWIDEKAAPDSNGSNGKLRGGKGELWEGGIRVPGIIEWPARIKPAAITQIPTCTSDIYPTIVDLLHIDIPDQTLPLDGISLVPLLDDKMKSRPAPIGFWHFGKTSLADGPAAWSDNQYKLHQRAPGHYELYDLTRDISEKTNLAASHPEVVQRMKAELDAWQKSVLRSNRGEDYPEKAVVTSSAWQAAELPVYCDPDDDWAKDPSVIKVGNTYYMYYTSANPWQDGGAGGKGEPRIDYATSPDGLKWTYQGLAVAKGKPGEWDDERPQAPAKPILKNGIYYMYYAGKNAKSAVAIGYATSTDLRHWTKNSGNPVLSIGKCNDPFIYSENGTYYLFHTTGGDIICYVTSTDLNTWSSTPVSTGAVGEGSIVIKDGSTYTMLGCIGFSGNGEYYETYAAQDLAKPFTDCGKTKINISEFAKGSLCHGDILRQGDENWFYFQATRNGGRKFQIGLAKQSVPPPSK